MLETGDYSLANLESQVAIERKSIDDLIACLTTERDRFERELQRGRSLDYFALVIEGSLMDLANGNYRSEMSPKAALQSLFARLRIDQTVGLWWRVGALLALVQLLVIFLLQ